MLTLHTLLVGLVIFLARLADVSLGTIRTLATVQGRSQLAFILGFFEITLWVTVISAIVQEVNDQPILGLFYGLGFATGNVVGMSIERKLAMGFAVLRVITRNAGEAIASTLRQRGQSVTTFLGEGMKGPVMELFIVSRRKDLKDLLGVIKKEDPEAFYIIEHAQGVSKIQYPIFQPTGWRAIIKKK